jgi:hypothetical protein
LRGDDDIELDGHSVRALIEVINGKIKGLGRRLDDQIGSGERASEDDWDVVMPPGQWTNLAATFNFNTGTPIQLYKNGQLIEMSNWSVSAWQRTPGTDYTSSTNAGGIKIGGSFPDNSQEQNPFNGRTDELMFFNKTLSAAEVLAQFQLVSDIPGDFNQDGTVNAADYTVWRNGLGTAYTAGDYEVWKTHFGDTATSGAGGATTVPETMSLALVIGLLPSYLARRRR